MEAHSIYLPTFWALVGMAGLLFLQLLVVDVLGIVRRHPPGTPVAPSSKDLLFRVTRAHANSNESMAMFILLAFAGMFLGAQAQWLNGLCVAYVVCRLGYTLVYYLNWRRLRSTIFGLSLVMLLGLLLVNLQALTNLDSL